MTQLWYKVTNNNEKHYDHQYVDGLNVLNGSFNDDSNASCCPGGLYYSDIHNIYKFFNYGCHLREITLPVSDPEFKMIKDPSGDKWRANKIILGTRYDLCNPDTWKYLINNGFDIHTNNDWPLLIASEQGWIEIVKFLIENGANMFAYGNYTLKIAAFEGHLEVVKFLIQKGANLHDDNEDTLRSAAIRSRWDIVQYLIENGADIHTDHEFVLDRACEYGTLEIVEFLIEKGADISANGGHAIKLARCNSNPEVMNFILKKSGST